MFDGSYPLINQILISFVLLIFLVASVAGIALGIGLNFTTARTLDFLRSMNRWVSVRDNIQAMEQTHDIDKAVYRHRRWIGAIFAICGGYTVFMLLFAIDFSFVITALSKNTKPIIVELVVDSLRWLLVVGGAFAFIIGAMMLASTSAMPAVDARANRWYSPGKLGESVDKMHLTLDDWVEAFPRFIGLLIGIGSAIVLIAAIIVWMAK